jgi:hypothetical protein
MAQAGHEPTWVCGAPGCLVTSPAIRTRGFAYRGDEIGLTGIGRWRPGEIDRLGRYRPSANQPPGRIRSADMNKVLFTPCGKLSYAAPNTRQRCQAAARAAHIWRQRQRVLRSVRTRLSGVSSWWFAHRVGGRTPPRTRSGAKSGKIEPVHSTPPVLLLTQLAAAAPARGVVYATPFASTSC